MVSILLVAHAPLASALLDVARHAYADCNRAAVAVDIAPENGLDAAVARITTALATLPGPEVLVLVDAYGATPGNAALAAVHGLQACVVAGVNVPMLWRTLCYGALPLGELAIRAADGGRQGIMQVASPCIQNQPHRPPSDDPDKNSDQ